MTEYKKSFFDGNNRKKCKFHNFDDAIAHMKYCHFEGEV